MDIMTLILLFGGIASMLVLLAFAFAGPSQGKAQARRLSTLKARVSGTGPTAVEAQMKRILAQRDTKLDDYVSSLLPNPARLRKRIEMTGKSWTLGGYAMVTAGIWTVVSLLAWLRGFPLPLSLTVGALLGIGLPHMAVGTLIKKRVAKFNAKFPDAIELLVRGLRSGLPITETLGVVGSEVPGPVGIEFRAVADKMKIGRTMDAALQETAERLGTPEFQFFCITLQIQRETGGNLAETLGNLAEVLRKRAQMKLKIAAMSSESKASAYIIGALPFLVFGIIFYINPDYMGGFFSDQRLMIAGGGGLIWMGIGAYIMKQMINFEI